MFIMRLCHLWIYLSLVFYGGHLCDAGCLDGEGNFNEKPPKSFAYEEKVLPVVLEGSQYHIPSLEFMNAIFKIISSEVIGYKNITIVEDADYCPTRTDKALDRLMGCTTETCYESSYEHTDSTPSINLEVWLSNPLALADYSDENFSDAGHLGVYGRYGWYISENFVHTTWERDRIAGDHWRSLQNTDYTSQLSQAQQFAISEALCGVPLGNTSLDFTCNKTIGSVLDTYCPPWCVSLTSPTCGMLLADYPEHNRELLTSQILALELYVTVIWVGPALHSVVSYLLTIDLPVLYFNLSPSDLTSGNNFTRIMFPTCPAPDNAQGDYTIGGCDYPWHPIRKIVWTPVEQNIPNLYQLVQKMSFDDVTLEDALRSYSESALSVEEFACNWLLSSTYWYNWLPASVLYVRERVFIPALFPYLSGPSSTASIYLGAEMAIKEVNKNAFTLVNVELELQPHQTHCEAEEAVNIYVDLLKNNTHPVAGFVGPACSPELESMSTVAKYLNQVIISYFADSITLSDRDRHPYVFRTFPDIGENAIVMEELFKYFDWQDFEFITEDQSIFRDTVADLENSLLRSGMQCTICSQKTIFQAGTNRTLDKMLSDIKLAEPDVIIGHFEEALAPIVMCEAFKLSMTPKDGYIWILSSYYSDDWWDVDAMNVSDEVGCTTKEVWSAVMGSMSLSRFHMEEPEVEVAGGLTVEAWKSQYDQQLDAKGLLSSPFAAYAYDTVWTYAFALDKLFLEERTAIDTLTSEKTKSMYLQYLRSTSFIGVTGQVNFVNQDRRGPITVWVSWATANSSKVLVGEYTPLAGSTSEGSLYIDEDAYKSFGDIFPYQDNNPVKVCTVEAVRQMLGSSCAIALMFVSVLITTMFLLVVISMGLLFKRRYDKKVRKTEQRLKDLGLIGLGGAELVSLDKWEMPREDVIINRKLGEGAFGTVYGGEAMMSRDCWAAVAVKTLKLGSSVVEKLDFLSEAEMMKRFEHENIIKLLGVCTRGEPIYAVMEFMLYGDLKTFLLARRHLVGQLCVEAEVLQPRNLTSMVHDIASGLSYLANHNYVHRDLACRNCLVDSQYRVKLGDFGMTRALYDSAYYRLRKQSRLPVRWMAPESVREGLFTTMSDIWSLGVVVYEVVTFGGFPYQEMSNTTVVDYIRERHAMTPPETCPPILSSLMVECWNIEPSVRPTADDVKEILKFNPELITPCLSSPHGSVSIDDISQDSFSQHLGQSLRSSIFDMSSEGSQFSWKTKSSFPSLRQVFRSSWNSKGSKKKSHNHSRDNSTSKDIEMGSPSFFSRGSKKRNSDKSSKSWASSSTGTQKVMQAHISPINKGGNRFPLKKFNSLDGYLEPSKGKLQERCNTGGDVFTIPLSQPKLSHNDAAKTVQNKGGHVTCHVTSQNPAKQRKPRSDSAPLLPKNSKRRGRLRSRSTDGRKSDRTSSSSTDTTTVSDMDSCYPCFHLNGGMNNCLD